MKKIVLISIVFLSSIPVLIAQQFNSQVTVNAEQTGKTQLSIFKTLEKAVKEFVDNTDWTGDKLEDHQKINCSFFINVIKYNSNQFTATLQVQSSRPVFGSTTETPILNIKDNKVNFDYKEFQPLIYDPNAYSSNLVSVLSFYVYTILGFDADTFETNGGSDFHEVARQIVNTAQQGKRSGWSASDGNNSRYQLNQEAISPNLKAFKEVMYKYHREGLDQMYAEQEMAKEQVKEALLALKNVNDARSNTYLLRSFFDAKSDEIQQIFSGGTKTSVKELLNVLNSVAPLHSKKWQEIKY